MNLSQAARSLAQCLNERQVRVVFAESCTAGLAAAALAQTPGISRWLCGSAVVYREQTKMDWLGVSRADLEQHTAVSEQVAQGMATGVLNRTVEAAYAAAVTGHLGPDAPEGFDGVIFIAVAWRGGEESIDGRVWRHQLTATGRQARQEEAAALLLKRLEEVVSEPAKRSREDSSQ